mgnify:CR=1 FL=1
MGTCVTTESLYIVRVLWCSVVGQWSLVFGIRALVPRVWELGSGYGFWFIDPSIRRSIVIVLCLGSEVIVLGIWSGVTVVRLQI